MAQQDIQDILNESQCLIHYGPGGWPLLEIKLLSEWLLALNPSADTDPKYLIESARCYQQYGAQAWLLKLGLLKNILLGLNPSAETDPQSLINNCYNNFGQSIWAILDITFLKKIVLANNPAAEVDPAVLLKSSQCQNNYSAQSWAMRLALLAQISSYLNTSASVDAASLLAGSGCYNCFGPGLWPLMEVQLLSQIFTYSGVTSPSILLESGDYVLTETGGHILLE